MVERDKLQEFRAMISRGRSDKKTPIKYIPPAADENAENIYHAALEQLSNVLTAEKQGRLVLTGSIDTFKPVAKAQKLSKENANQDGMEDEDEADGERPSKKIKKSKSKSDKGSSETVASDNNVTNASGSRGKKSQSNTTSNKKSRSSSSSDGLRDVLKMQLLKNLNVRS
jgi:hypothetical protein